MKVRLKVSDNEFIEMGPGFSELYDKLQKDGDKESFLKENFRSLIEETYGDCLEVTESMKNELLEKMIEESKKVIK